MSHELSRLESQIAALSELASRANRELAEQVAADSQKQIDRINQLLLLVSDSQSGDATVQSRSQDSVRSTSPAIADSCVRQSSVEYVVGDSKQADDADPIYQLISEKAVWFPGLFSESDRAIA